MENDFQFFHSACLFARHRINIGFEWEKKDGKNVSENSCTMENHIRQSSKSSFINWMCARGWMDGSYARKTLISIIIWFAMSISKPISVYILDKLNILHIIGKAKRNWKREVVIFEVFLRCFFMQSIPVLVVLLQRMKTMCFMKRYFILFRKSMRNFN